MTRALISWKVKKGWEGRLHEEDGEPTALGPALWEAYRKRFRKRMDLMRRILFGEHKNGWRTIVGVNWKYKPGRIELPEQYRVLKAMGLLPPQCYCHSGNGKSILTTTNFRMPETPLTHRSARWLYVIDSKTALVRVFQEDGAYRKFGATKTRWKKRGEFHLDKPKPNFYDIECGPNLEWCKHPASVHDSSVCATCHGVGYIKDSGHHAKSSAKCGPQCIPDAGVPAPLRMNIREYHHVNPRLCMDCRGTGASKCGSSQSSRRSRVDARGR